MHEDEDCKSPYCSQVPGYNEKDWWALEEASLHTQHSISGLFSHIEHLAKEMEERVTKLDSCIPFLAVLKLFAMTIKVFLFF